MSIESGMPSSHLILCHPLLLLLPIPPSIRVFFSESTLGMRWPKYWSFSFSISPSNEHPGLISFRMDWLDLLALDSLSLDWASRSYSDELACPVSCPCADTCLKHSWQGEATHISRTQALGAPPLRTGRTVRVSPQGCRCHRCLKHIFKPYLI